MPIACAADRRPGGLEGGERRLAVRVPALAGPGEPLLQLLATAEHQTAGHADVVEDDLGRVAGTDAQLAELGPHRQALRAAGHHEGRLAPGAERRVDRGHDHVDIRDPAVRDPGLDPVQHPLVGGFVVDGPGPQRGDVAAGVGFAHAERGQADLVLAAEALGQPLAHLLGRALAHDADGAEDRAHDRQADAGVTPEQLLEEERDGLAGPVRERVGQEVEAVQPDPGRLLDDRPR